MSKRHSAQFEDAGSTEFVNIKQKKSLFDILSDVFAAIAVLICIFFTFLIGVEVDGGGADIQLDLAPAKLFGTLKDLSFSFDRVLYGAIVAFLTVVFIVIFSLSAVFRYVKRARGRSRKDYACFIFAVIASYLGGCVAFLSLYMERAAYAVSANHVVTGYFTYDFATLLGVALSSVSLSAFFVCRILKDVDVLIFGDKFGAIFLPSMCALFLGVVLHLAGASVMDEDITDSKSSTVDYAGRGGGYFRMIGIIRLSVENGTLTAGYETALSVALFGQVLQFFLIISVGVTLVKYLAEVLGKADKVHIKSMAVTEFLAVAHLAVSICCGKLYMDALFGSDWKDWCSLSFAPPICVLALTTLSLIMSAMQASALRPRRSVKRNRDRRK